MPVVSQWYNLWKKLDLLKLITEIILCLNSLHGQKISMFQLDPGGKYYSNDMKDWSSALENIFEHTTTKIPENNGKAGRLTRTLPVARVLLSTLRHRSNYLRLLAEAVETASILRNPIFTKSRNQNVTRLRKSMKKGRTDPLLGSFGA